MANHVTTNVRFEKLNDAGKAKLQELFARLGEKQEVDFALLWGLSEEITNDWEWQSENVGPKWCFFEERDDDSFRLLSAWSFPQAGIEWLFDQIGEVDPDFLASIFYEDEMPNFFGVYIYNKEGMIDGCEWGEDGEIEELMKEMVPALRELDEEQSEVYWELWTDNIWDLVHDKQSQVYNDIMEYIKSRE